MNTYHPSLYKDVLEDYNYRFPKFHPIPYPTPPQSSEPVLKQRPIWNPKNETN